MKKTLCLLLCLLLVLPMSAPAEPDEDELLVEEVEEGAATAAPEAVWKIARQYR